MGPNKDDVWHSLSKDLNGKFIKDRGKFRDKDTRVEIKHGKWKITLDSYTISSGQGTFGFITRMRAPFITKDGFRFKIYRKSILGKAGNILGKKDKDVQVGFPEFDDNFIIDGNYEEKLKHLFKNSKIRELISCQPASFRLDVKKCIDTYFPENVYELFFETGGEIKDIERLKQLFYLFAEILDQLSSIGSIYKDDPKVDVI